MGVWDIVDGVMSDILKGVVPKALWRIISAFPAGLRQHSDVDIGGFWLGQVHGSNETIYNLYRIDGTGCNKKFYIEHFISRDDRVLTLHGEGDFRAPNLSGYYAFDDKSMSKNGTVNFQLGTFDGHKPILHGRYTQFSNTSPEIAEGQREPVVHRRYSLVKVDVPFARRCRHVFRRTYFRNLADLKAFIQSLPGAVKEQINPFTSDDIYSAVKRNGITSSRCSARRQTARRNTSPPL